MNTALIIHIHTHFHSEGKWSRTLINNRFGKATFSYPWVYYCFAHPVRLPKGFWNHTNIETSVLKRCLESGHCTTLRRLQLSKLLITVLLSSQTHTQGMRVDYISNMLLTKQIPMSSQFIRNDLITHLICQQLTASMTIANDTNWQFLYKNTKREWQQALRKCLLPSVLPLETENRIKKGQIFISKN